MARSSDDLFSPAFTHQYSKRLLRTLGWVAQGGGMRLRQFGGYYTQQMVSGLALSRLPAQQGERLLHHYGLASRTDVQQLDRRLQQLQQQLAMHRLRRDQQA